MRFRLFGIRFYVSFYFFAYVTFMMLLDRNGLVMAALMSAAVHETGHLIAMMIQRCRVLGINLSPGRCIIDAEPFKTVKAQIITLVCGPVVNIAAGVCFLVIFALFGLRGCFISAVINIALGIINLLPVKGLDMGSIIFALVKPENERKALVLGRVFAVAVCAVFALLVYKEAVHFSVLVICAYLLYRAFAKI